MAFFVPFYIAGKLKPLPKNEQSVRKILFWKFISQGKWRTAVIIIALIIFHLGVVSPYLIYKQDKPKIELLPKVQSDLVVYKAALNEVISSCKDQPSWQKEGDLGFRAFMNGNWAQSAVFLNLAFEDEKPHEGEYVLCYPLYCCDLLKINQSQHTNDYQPDQEAIDLFEQNLADMTNQFYSSISQQLPESYDSIPQLEQNIKKLEIIKGVVPGKEAEYVQTIIETVSSYTNLSLAKHAKINNISN